MHQFSIFDIMQHDDLPLKVGDIVISDELIKGKVVEISDDYIRSVLDDGSIHLTPKLYFKYFFKVVSN